MMRFMLSLCVVLMVVQTGSSQVLEKLTGLINTSRYDELSPVLSADGHSLYFTRAGDPHYDRTLLFRGKDLSGESESRYRDYLREIYRQLSGKEISDPTRSDFNQDVWIAESRESFFDHVYHPSAPLNNALPNSICAQTNALNEFVVINQFPREGGMDKGFSLVRQLPDSTWTWPEPLEIKDFYTKDPGVGLTISRDGRVIILSLQREDSRGGTDLYISFKEKDGSWSKPINLGAHINSSFRELTPQLAEDDRTLFFSSDRPGSEGIDIYFSYRQGNGWSRWSAPSRMGNPVNSKADDSQPHFNDRTGYLYFSSNRDGSSDIFRVQLIQTAAQNEVPVHGRIYNSATDELMGAKIYTSLKKGAFEKTFYVSTDGYFRIKIPKEESVFLVPEKEGYLGHPQAISLSREKYYFEPLRVDLFLDPVSENVKLTLAPIFFKRSTSIILAESHAELDYLAEQLINHRNIYIQIEGHTDNMGAKRSLKKLSEERAQAVKDFLVRAGVDPARIRTVGFGDSHPLNANATEAERSRNRRVEVRIVQVDGVK